MSKIINIKDEQLLKYISWQISGDEITEKALESVKSLVMAFNCEYDPNSYWIDDLTHLKNLRSLTIRFDTVHDYYFDAFKKLDKLDDVTFDNCCISSPELAADLNLRSLSFWNCHVYDTSFVTKLTGLHSLTLVNENVDIEVINTLKKLRYLNITASKLPLPCNLSIHSLENLHIEDSNIKDLSFVESLPRLESLSIDESQYDANKNLVKLLVKKDVDVLLDGFVSIECLFEDD